MANSISTSSRLLPSSPERVAVKSAFTLVAVAESCPSILATIRVVGIRSMIVARPANVALTGPTPTLKTALYASGPTCSTDSKPGMQAATRGISCRNSQTASTGASTAKLSRMCTASVHPLPGDNIIRHGGPDQAVDRAVATDQVLQSGEPVVGFARLDAHPEADRLVVDRDIGQTLAPARVEHALGGCLEVFIVEAELIRHSGCRDVRARAKRDQHVLKRRRPAVLTAARWRLVGNDRRKVADVHGDRRPAEHFAARPIGHNVLFIPHLLLHFASPGA